MPDMPDTDDLRASLEALLAEIDHEATLLRHALAALNGGSGPSTSAASAAHAASPAKKQPKSKPKRTRPKRAAEPIQVAPAGKLQMLLAKTDGLTTAGLAEQANGDRDQVLTLLREMEAQGKIRRSGKRAGTRWHA